MTIKNKYMAKVVKPNIKFWNKANKDKDIPAELIDREGDKGVVRMKRGKLSKSRD